MKIGIANDHSSVLLKNQLVEYLTKNNHQVINYGTNSEDSCNYPEYGEILSKSVASKEVELGIAICGTGVGISIACNKVKGIRACVCSEPVSARLSREHNNANIICFGSRIVGFELAKSIVDTFINTAFSNDVRHIKRIELITNLEN